MGENLHLGYVLIAEVFLYNEVRAGTCISTILKLIFVRSLYVAHKVNEKFTCLICLTVYMPLTLNFSTNFDNLRYFGRKLKSY